MLRPILPNCQSCESVADLQRELIKKAEDEQREQMKKKEEEQQHQIKVQYVFLKIDSYFLFLFFFKFSFFFFGVDKSTICSWQEWKIK